MKTLVNAQGTMGLPTAVQAMRDNNILSLSGEVIRVIEDDFRLNDGPEEIEVEGIIK